MSGEGYAKTQWVTGDTITATKLNNNENGTEDLDTRRVMNY